MHGSKVLFVLKRFLSRMPVWAPLLFFAVLLLTRVSEPQEMVFDEGHYIPAAKELISFGKNLNFEHPPLGKFILGFFWLFFSKTLGIFSDLTSFRLSTVIFGVFTLWGLQRWLIALKFRERAANAAVWLTGFNFLWFVQAKTAMLDMFCIGFAIWGLLFIYRDQENLTKFFLGWFLLGLALACKWLALPFILIALVFCRSKLLFGMKGVLLSFFAYWLCFLPLAFLEQDAVALGDFFSYHKEVLWAFQSLEAGTHPYAIYWQNVPKPYASHWWEWPTLIRPMWYYFKSSNDGVQGIWAGGNPLLYWVALPLILLILVKGIQDFLSRRKKLSAFQVLSIMYWVPLLFWAIVPRGLQMYYYYLASSLWVGPIVVGAHEYFATKYSYKRMFVQSRLLWGFVILAGALFLYFLPILDARVLPQDRYLIYMWFQSWI